MPVQNINEQQEALQAKEEALLKVFFGYDTEVTSTNEGFEIKGTLESGTLEGGQEISVAVGHREDIPLEIEGVTLDLHLTGLPVKILRVNGKEFTGDYTIYLAPQTLEGVSLAADNFAVVETNSIVIASMRDADCIANLVHEIGHIRLGHTVKERMRVIQIIQGTVGNYYNEETQSYNLEGMFANQTLMSAFKEVYGVENDANNWAEEFFQDPENPIFPNDQANEKLKVYLQHMLALIYFDIYNNGLAEAVQSVN